MLKIWQTSSYSAKSRLGDAIMTHAIRIQLAMWTALVVHSSASAHDVAKLAADAWAATNTIMETHAAAPARQEMLLQAVRALLGHAGAEVPADLNARVSKISDEKQWLELLRDIWPKTQGGKDTGNAEWEAALFAGLVSAAPGKLHILSAAERRAMEQFGGNRYVGTGIQIRYNAKEKLAQLVSPFRNGPAHNAGARP